MSKISTKDLVTAAKKAVREVHAEKYKYDSIYSETEEELDARRKRLGILKTNKE